MPAEWEPHERTLVVWPARRSLWDAQLDAARAAHVAVVRAVARFEPVTVVANARAAGAGDEAERALAGIDGVDVVEEPVDDSWVRDTGPIVVTDRRVRAAPSTSASTAGARSSSPSTPTTRSRRGSRNGSVSGTTPRRSCSKAARSRSTAPARS